MSIVSGTRADHRRSADVRDLRHRGRNKSGFVFVLIRITAPKRICALKRMFEKLRDVCAFFADRTFFLCEIWIDVNEIVLSFDEMLCFL